MQNYGYCITALQKLNKMYGLIVNNANTRNVLLLQNTKDCLVNEYLFSVFIISLACRKTRLSLPVPVPVPYCTVLY